MVYGQFVRTANIGAGFRVSAMVWMRSWLYWVFNYVGSCISTFRDNPSVPLQWSACLFEDVTDRLLRQHGKSSTAIAARRPRRGRPSPNTSSDGAVRTYGLIEHSGTVSLACLCSCDCRSKQSLYGRRLVFSVRYELICFLVEPQVSEALPWLWRSVAGRPLTAEVRIQMQANPCHICDGQSATSTYFSLSTAVFPCQ